MRRRNINARYSLRAFARDISMSPSRLSEVIGGKGDLSREKGEVIAKNLQMDTRMAADFIDSIDSVVAPLLREREAAKRRIQGRSVRQKSQRRLDDPSFQIIADPKYVLIWTFMLLPAYNERIESISEHLNLNVIEVFDALKKLERAGLVRYDHGKWTPSRSEFSTGDLAPSESVRAFHRKISDLGHQSIEGQSMAVRHLDSVVIPFDSLKIDEVKQKIANFAQSLVEDYGVAGDSVYAMSLKFFKMAGPFLPRSSSQTDEIH